MLVATQMTIGALSACLLIALATRGRRQLRSSGARGVTLFLLCIGGGVFADSTLAFGRFYAQVGVAALFLYSTIVLAITRRRHELEPPQPGWFLLIALWAWVFAVDVLSGAVAGFTTAAGRALSGLALLAFLYIVRWRGVTIQSFAMAVLAVLAAVGIITAVLPYPWRACDQFKCGALGTLMTGPFSSENYLGVLAGWACVLAFVSFTGPVRNLGVILSLAVLVGTGARSSLYATAGAVIVFVLLTRYRTVALKGPAASRQLRLPLAFSALAALFSLALWLLFTATPTTLSNRGNIWVSALAVLDDHLITGLGLDRWEPLTLIGAIPEHFPHNGYLLLLFSGGFVALGLFLAVLTRTSLAKQPNEWPSARLSLVLLFLTLSLTEVLWNPLTFDGLTWTVVTLLAAGTASHEPSAGLEQAQRMTTKH